MENARDRRRVTPQAVKRVALWILTLWVVVTGVLVVVGIVEARAAVRELEEIRTTAETTDLLGGRVTLDPIADRFGRAERYLSSPLLAPVERLPLLGRQIRAASTMAGSGKDVVRAAADLLSTTAADLDDGLPSGPARVEFLEALAADLASLRQEVRSVDRDAGAGLVGPVRTAQRRFERSLVRADEVLADAVHATTAVGDLLRGPSSYLVLAANNAEMRIGSGMFLSAGHLRIDSGLIHLDGFEAAGELVLDEDDAVPVPPQIERLWGWSHPGRDLRSLGLSPRFPANAAIASRLWEASGRPPVHGVLVVDVIALRNLLRATGPTRVGGVELDAGMVVRHLLHDQYVDLRTTAANASRRERLAAVASAVVDRLDEGSLGLEELVRQLGSSASGRHVLLWSADPATQRAWRILGVDGDVGDRSLAVGVANIDASKLDPFVDVDTELHLGPRDGDGREVRLRASVANRTPAGEPPYILGPDRSPDYQGLFVAYLPGKATDVRIEGDGSPVAGGRERHSVVVARELEIAEGSVARIDVRFRLPTAVAASIETVPTARVTVVDEALTALVLGDAARDLWAYADN